MKVLIQNGHVLDPVTSRNGVYDVLVEDDKIVKVEKGITAEADKVIDAEGCYVMPGFVDLHVHFRDPGLEYKETLKTGGEAAVHGGVTTVCAMPNTKPVIDNGVKISEVQNRAKKESKTNVLQLGSVTIGQMGEDLADIKGLCRTCQSGKCNWGIATQNPELVERLDPQTGSRRLINLMTAWKHEIKELMGGMGINSIEALRGNRLMLRGIGLNEKELEILGISHAGE